MKSIDGLREYVVSMLSNMIRINSENPPGREEELASYVAERLAELGFKAWIDRFQGRANALGSIRIGDGKKIMLVSHLDTVPAGERELWGIPPFSGIVRDGRVYGRGAADAKGCLASMLGCLKILADEGWPINGEIIFAAVADEESENRGIRRLVAQGVKADYAVVGEPTNLNVCIAHKGSIFLRASFIGRAAHSSKPERGVNAVYAASEYALRIEKLSRRFKVKHRLLGKPSLAVTIFRGGVKDNVIPDRCELVINRRTLPNEDLETVVNQLKDLAMKVSKERRVKAFVKIDRYLPASETDKDEEIVKAGLRAVSRVLGKRARPKGFQATCDMTFLVHRANIPCIILGPGRLEEAHAINEWIEIDQLVNGSKIYHELIMDLIGSR
ncbi:MAG: M20 family metallopeptidase [Thaumarchaeota archaeon]|nr:M20 family metallopeptidase [Nitrososphaerota archaeon]